MRKWIKIFEAQEELFPGYDQAHHEQRLGAWLGSTATWHGGRPKVFYHATDKNFDAFKTVNQGFASALGMAFQVDRHGAFFAEDPKFAEEFIHQDGYGYKKGAVVIPVYLSIQNPIDLTDDGLNRIIREDALVEEFARNDIDLKSIYFYVDEYTRWELFDGPEGEDFVQALTKMGFDGAVLEERTENAESGRVWVAFHPNQIKSAIGNRGSFSPDSDDITK